jgi:hypothetical protein
MIFPYHTWISFIYIRFFGVQTLDLICVVSMDGIHSFNKIWEPTPWGMKQNGAT